MTRSCARCKGCLGPQNDPGLPSGDMLALIGLNLCWHCRDVLIMTRAPELADALRPIIEAS